MKLELWVIPPLFFIICALVVFGLIVHIMFDQYQNEKVCKENDYDEVGEMYSEDMEPGYIICCKDNYVNHRNKPNCDVVKQ